MNMIRLGVLVSSLSLLSCFGETIAQFFASSQSHFTTASEENMLMNKKKKDASLNPNASAQKHFRNIQQMC